MEPQSSRSSLFLPVSILVAGVLIAGGLVYNAGIRSLGDTQQANVSETTTGSAKEAKDVTADDHIRGPLNAPVKLIEFSDTECPFCKSFHPTLKRIVEEFDGQVAWVYRHFPLDSIHSKARQEAKATECAAKLGGKDDFWRYIDRLFEITPSNDQLDLKLLPQIATEIGLNRSQFEACLASAEFDKKIQDHFDEAVAAGGEGTPYTIVVSRDGKKQGVSGALPYPQFKLIVEEALK